MHIAYDDINTYFRSDVFFIIAFLKKPVMNILYIDEMSCVQTCKINFYMIGFNMRKKGGTRETFAVQSSTSMSTRYLVCSISI